MSDPVRIAFDGRVARVTIDNPPVNVTSQAVRSAPEASGAERVLPTGAGRAFVAGANAKEFDALPQPPHLPDVVARIEIFPIPIVAAINGAALGGGLELALACAARVAAPGATLGLPEVTLGVVPGAGGTQRLPRVIGFEPALSLISEGRVIGADEALDIVLVDATSDDPVAAASTLTLPERAATGALPNPATDATALAAARSRPTSVRAVRSPP